MPCSGCGGGGNVGRMAGARTTNSPQDEQTADHSDDYVVTYPNGVTRRVYGEQAAADEVAAYGGEYAASEGGRKRRTRKT